MPEHQFAGLAVTPILSTLAAGAAQADAQRSLEASVLDAIRRNPVMGFTATTELAGAERSMVDVAHELEAVAAQCTSSAWVLWNHLCTFHLFAGLLGPSNAGWLRALVERGEWVCFPAGASTAVKGERTGERIVLNGKGAFGSGARYAQWAGASFIMDDPGKPRFGLVRLDQAGVHIEADWQAMSLRASATDTVHYNNAELPANHCVDFPLLYRVAFRDPARPMIHPRYREDWVGLSDLWLGAMAVGLVGGAFAEVTSGIRDRIAIMGVKVAQRPTVHVNIGLAQANLQAARDTVLAACAATDERIAAQVVPDEGDYLRQLAAAAAALRLTDESLRLLQRVMGGNGLREGPAFERRVRDFQAMPLHINAHQDRVNEAVGRHALGLPPDNPF